MRRTNTPKKIYIFFYILYIKQNAGQKFLMLSILIYCLINYLSISYQIKFIYFFLIFTKRCIVLTAPLRSLPATCYLKEKLNLIKPTIEKTFYPLTAKNEISRPGNLTFIVLDPEVSTNCLLYTSPSPRDKRQSRMPSSA